MYRNAFFTLAVTGLFVGTGMLGARAQAPYEGQAPPPGYDAQQGPAGGDQNQAAAPEANGDPQAGAPADSGGDDPNQSASFQTFYNQLANEGNWVETGDYGYVWQPSVNDPEWAPYTNGHWVYTDDGWTWVADDSEPWGWATYHYGRWVCLDDTGWCWVPGYTWAPAWVSWRYGGGYCGWAPLPPATGLGIDFFGGNFGFGFGFHIGGDVDTAYGIGPGWYHFLPVGYLGRGNYRGFYANRYNNFGIINRTTNVTNVNVTNRATAGRFGRVTTGGPSFAAVSAQSQEPIARAQLARSGTVGTAALRGNSLAVYAPRVGAAAAGVTPHPATARTLGQATVNRGTDINRPTLANAALRPAEPSATQLFAAREAQAATPGRARVATAETPVSRAVTQPLSSMQSYHEAAASPGGRTVAGNSLVNRSAPAVNAPQHFYSGSASTPEGNAEAVREREAAFNGGGGAGRDGRAGATYPDDRANAGTVEREPSGQGVYNRYQPENGDGERTERSSSEAERSSSGATRTVSSIGGGGGVVSHGAYAPAAAHAAGGGSSGHSGGSSGSSSGNNNSRSEH